MCQPIGNKGSVRENAPNPPYLRVQRYSSPLIIPYVLVEMGFR
jgi:hypothetical protein